MVGLLVELESVQLGLAVAIGWLFHPFWAPIS